MRKTVLLFFMMITAYIYGQDSDRKSTRGGEQKVQCLREDIGYLIDEKFYLAGTSTIYLCESLLPLKVIFCNQNKEPINDPNLEWEGITHLDSDPVYEAYIHKSDFNNDLLKFTVKFENEYLLNQKVSKNLDFKPVNISGHGYDSNQFIEYTPSKTNPPLLPWIFCKLNFDQNIQLKSTKKNGESLPFFQHLRTTPITNNVILDHYKFTKQFDNFVIRNINHTEEVAHLSGCTDKIQAMLYTKPDQEINVPIKYIVISESDDDVANYCLTDPSKKKNCIDLISDPYHECILPGLDGTFEEHFKLIQFNTSGFSPDFKPSWVNYPADNIIIESINNEDSPKIVAGEDRMCSTSPLIEDNYLVQWGSTAVIQEHVNNANSIFNNYDININYDNNIAQVISMNYDLWVSNNQLERTNGYETNEIKKIVKNLFPEAVKVILVDAINDGSALGLASRGGNIVWLTQNTRTSTLAHEIGHARFSLRHCDDDPGYLNEESNDNTPNHETVDDEINLMYSNPSIEFPPIIQILRHYQWKKIFTGKYN